MQKLMICQKKLNAVEKFDDEFIKKKKTKKKLKIILCSKM
jgi:hypothetical protein